MQYFAIYTLFSYNSKRRFFSALNDLSSILWKKYYSTKVIFGLHYTLPFNAVPLWCSSTPLSTSVSVQLSFGAVNHHFSPNLPQILPYFPTESEEHNVDMLKCNSHRLFSSNFFPFFIQDIMSPFIYFDSRHVFSVRCAHRGAFTFIYHVQVYCIYAPFKCCWQSVRVTLRTHLHNLRYGDGKAYFTITWGTTTRLEITPTTSENCLLR